MNGDDLRRLRLRSVRKGYDTGQVRAFLARVADALDGTATVTSGDVRRVEFTIARRGADPDQVDVLLDGLAEELARRAVPAAVADDEPEAQEVEATTAFDVGFGDAFTDDDDDADGVEFDDGDDFDDEDEFDDDEDDDEDVVDVVDVFGAEPDPEPDPDELDAVDVSDVVIEIAVPKDATELLAALERLVPQLSRSNPPPGPAAVAELLMSPAITQFVARERGEIVGVATLAVFPIPTGRRAWIEDVIVDADARGQGIGERLTRAMLDRAEDLGCVTVDLTSRPNREAANRLYRRAGFTQRNTNVWRMTLDA